jgi:DNA repair protein RecN (Recombination protein N)
LRDIGERAQSLVGADGAAAELGEANKALQAAVRIDPSIEAVVSRLADVAVESADLAREIRSWTEGLDADPSELERLRERKVLISDLKRKHGGDIDLILAFAEEARERLEAADVADKRIDAIDADIDAARCEVDDLATALSTKRRKATKLLTKLVRSELPSLALPNATFEARLSEAELTRDGSDRVEFLFSSSRASPTHAIEKIASGGELSRAMIAVTLALAQTHAVPVMVFDEADQGVGGEAALDLGRRLARLGASHQVLVVSHLPQIAAFADRHIVVRRNDAVDVEVLDGDARSIEISRMLAGLESSERALAHAAELLELASTERGPSRARAG